MCVPGGPNPFKPESSVGPAPSGAADPWSGAWPAFCCAILRDPQGRYLLEKRPPRADKSGRAVARRARGGSGRAPREPGGLVTCFGGSREPSETPEQCIRRELLEELGWDVAKGHLAPAVRLVNAGTQVMRFRGGLVRPGQVIAWFYRGLAPGPETPLLTEPGYAALWLTPEETFAADLSRWHRTVLEAERRGEDACGVDW